MEFNEKLQELRKAKSLTQEELAEALFVSRAAISKWESGRGYPSLDSLKEISKFFSVSAGKPTRVVKVSPSNSTTPVIKMPGSRRLFQHRLPDFFTLKIRHFILMPVTVSAHRNIRRTVLCKTQISGLKGFAIYL